MRAARFCAALACLVEDCERAPACHADAFTLALLAEITSAHRNDVSSVAFSPDGKMILSGSADSSIKLWGGLCMSTLCSLSSCSGVGCSRLTCMCCRLVHRRADAGPGLEADKAILLHE